MALRSDARRWGGMAKTFHWLMALGIIGAGVLGLVMTEMDRGMAKLNAFAIHKSIGLTVLALFVLRLVWRFLDRRPADLPMPRMQRIAAHAAHGLLYLFMLAIPLSGWIFNSARGYPLQWFKQFNLPALAGKSESLAELARSLHEWGFWALLVLVLAHAGAALYHHLFLGDATLRRMLPGYRSSSAEKTP